LSEQVHFVERDHIPKGFVLVNGLPDVGLVGVVGLSHLISSLNMKEIGYVESDLFPPIVVLHDGIPKSPVRIFSSESIVALIAETAIPVQLIRPLANGIVEWAASKGASLIVSVGGMAVPNRQDLDAPKVFAALSEKSLEKNLRNAAEVLGEGYIVGVYGLILRKCAERNLPAITLLTQSFYNYPDPEAAAVALTALSKILNIKLDVSELLQKGEEIRLKAKDMMRRTQAEMARMDKSQEYEIPALYG
jgi:uncharacterized protein